MRPERLFGTVVGWLIGLGMVLFGLVGFMAINQATPLSPTTYLAAPTTASPTTTPSVPRTPSTSGKTPGQKGPSTSGKGSGKVSQAQLVSLGQSVIQAKCVACHVVNGSGGNIGPNLDLVMAGKTVPKMVPGGQPTNPAWLAKWIANPPAIYPQAIMPPLGLSAQQIQGVVAYLTTKVK